MAHTQRQKNAFRAKPAGARGWHSALYAELSRFVRGGADNAATFGAASHNDRLAAQLRPVPLLDGRVEGVHVDVEYREHIRATGVEDRPHEYNAEKVGRKCRVQD